MTKIFSKLAINYSLLEKKTPNSPVPPVDTLPLGAWVDDYETAYQWAKNWRAEA